MKSNPYRVACRKSDQFNESKLLMEHKITVQSADKISKIQDEHGNLCHFKWVIFVLFKNYKMKFQNKKVCKVYNGKMHALDKILGYTTTVV